MFLRFTLLCCLLFSSISSLFAAECLDVFPSASQTYGPELTLPSFKNSSGVDGNLFGSNLAISVGNYVNIEVSQNGVATFTSSNTEYRVEKLTVGQNSTVQFVAGDYWIDELRLEENSTLAVVGAGSVRIYADNILQFASNSRINQAGGNLIVVGYDDVELNGDASFTGALYVDDTLTLDKNVSILGAVTAEDINSNQGVITTYQESMITGSDFNGMCDNTPVVPAQPLANYRFDECEYTGTGFEVLDQTGNYSATSYGSVDTFDAGKIERGAELADEDHHFETSIPLPQDFSISTWFKKPTSNSNSRYFVLGAMQSGGDLLYLDRNNSWRWGVYSLSTGAQNGNYSFASLDSNWHHMALVYSGGQTELYIDGTLEDTINKAPTGTLKYIGTSFDSVSSSNPQSFRAPLDEFIVFDSALTSAEISDIYTNQNAENNYDGSSRDAVICSMPSPSTEYRFDETQYTGAANEIIDSIGGFHGLAKDSQPTEGKICNAIDLSATGIGNYAVLDEDTLTGKTDFSISLWAKTSKTANQSILSGAGASNNELIMWFTGHTNFRPYLKNTYNGNITTLSIADDNWHHLVWTRKGSQSCLFMDKALQGCATQSTSALNIQSLILGQEQDSIGGGFVSSQAFDGLLDELLIFDTAISSAQITTVYDNQDAGLGFDGSARSCPTPTPPVLDMRFDEVDWTAANSVLDSSGNNYHANAVDVTPTAGFICHAADLSASGVDDYITLDSQALNGRASFTISLWYKTPKTGTQSLISGANTSSFNELIFWFTNNTLFGPHLKGGYQAITTSNVSDDTWHHIVWTRSGSENLFYHDGALQSGSASLSTDALNITSLILGQEQDSLGGSFDSSQAVEGLIDELLVFKRSITATEVSSIFTNQTNGLNYDGTTRTDCLPLLHHFEIDVIDGQGLTCAADNITIKACADAACSTLNTDTNNVQLSINGTPDKTVTVVGSTDTTINYTTADVATLSLDQTYECVNGDPNACDVTFADAGFIFSQTSAVNDAIDNQEAGTPFTGYLRAVESVDGVCTGLFNGDVTVSLSQKNVLPNGTEGLTFTVKDTHSNTKTLTKHGTYIDVELAFNSASEAILTNATYFDAGQIQLYASYNSAGVNLVGSSNTFWVSPAELIVTAKSNGSDIYGDSNTSTIRHNAGESFDLVVTAVNSSGATTTPNYAPGNIQFKLIRTGPTSGGFDGDLTYALGSSLTSTLTTATPPPIFIDATLTDFEDGVSRYSVANYSEVGLLNLDIQDEDYGDVGIIVSGSDINIGRFIPEHFDQTVVADGSLDTVCNQNTLFAYTGQVLVTDDTKGAISYLVNPVVELTAKNEQGAITKNYTESGYMKLNAAANFIVAPTTDSTIIGKDAALLPLTANIATGTVSHDDLVAADGSTLADGVLHYELSGGDNFFYPRNENSEVNAEDNNIDFVIDQINFIDSDGVAIIAPENITDTTGINLRFGRAYLENSFGPETADLPQPFYTQYLNTSGSYIVNAQDSCTLLIQDENVLADDNFSLNPTGFTTINNDSATLVNGISRDFYLIAPGAGNQGAVDVEYDIYPWLLYDWDWNGVDAKEYNKNPTATATFGLFRGNDRIIYQREVH